MELSGKEINEVINLLPKHVHDRLNLQCIRDAYPQANSIRIVLTGRAGSGKSTLLNTLLGLNVIKDRAASEGKSISETCTTEIGQYSARKGDVDVVVWDTPGLLNSADNEHAYLEEIKMKCSEQDLALYCVNSASTRFVHGTENPDVLAMRRLTNTFGPNFWMNAVFVLTYANTAEAYHYDWKKLSGADKAVRFRSMVDTWRQQIRTILAEDIRIPEEIADRILVIPAGYLDSGFPGCDNWLSDLWLQCLTAIASPSAQAALIKLNRLQMTMPILNLPPSTNSYKSGLSKLVVMVIGTIGGSIAIYHLLYENSLLRNICFYIVKLICY